MSVSHATDGRLTVPPPLVWPMLVAGVLAAFATYWDEAWHTDVGRDTFWSAPHLLLYGSIGVVGLSVAGWGLAQLVTSRSLGTSVRNRPLVAGGIGALCALVAAPIDGVWHELYGRDAVLWSPPHMLALLGAVALVLGVSAGLPGRGTAARIAAGVLLLANGAAIVFEYEADVPQFTEVLYLPLLVVIAVAVAVVVERLVPRRGAVAAVALGYAAVRLLVMMGLAGLGRSMPDLPIAILGLAFWDLPRTSRTARAAAAVAGISAFALLASWLGLASQPAERVAVTAVPLLAVAVVVLSARSWRAPAAVATVAVASVLSLAPQERAEAHDPGQGDPVVIVDLTSSVEGCEIRMAAAPTDHCEDLEPLRVVARRAGQTIIGPLDDTGDCRWAGAVTVPSGGRWFTYVEFQHDNRTVEAWLPVDADRETTERERRELYLPSGAGQSVDASQIGFGAAIYLLGCAAIGLGLTAIGSTKPSADPRPA